MPTTPRYRRQSLWTGVLLVSCLVAQPGRAQTADSDSAVTPWDAAHSGWRGRLVVGEYGTATTCFLCQTEDQIFNHLLSRYPSTAFISLAYHTGLGVPLYDPADTTTQCLFSWYGDVRQTPFHSPFSKDRSFDNWIDGISRSDSYNDGDEAVIRSAVDSELTRPPEAFFHVKTTVQDGRILVRVKVDSVTGDHPKTLLRLVLVEDTVNLLSDGKPIKFMPRLVHHMVVRAFAHTKALIMGVPLQAPGSVQWTFDVAALQERHLRYHQVGITAMEPHAGSFNDPSGQWNARTKREMIDNIGYFPDQRDWTMDPLRLHVVAFVQDAQTGEVLQAAMVNLTPEDAKQLLPPKTLPVWAGIAADSAWMMKWGYKYLAN